MAAILWITDNIVHIIFNTRRGGFDNVVRLEFPVRIPCLNIDKVDVAVVASCGKCTREKNGFDDDEEKYKSIIVVTKSQFDGLKICCSGYIILIVKINERSFILKTNLFYYYKRNTVHKPIITDHGS